MKSFHKIILLFVALTSILSAAGQTKKYIVKLPTDFHPDCYNSGSIPKYLQNDADGLLTTFSYPNPQRKTYDTILCFDTLNNLKQRLVRLYNDSALLTEQSYEQYNGNSIVKNSLTYYKYYPDGSLNEREYHILDLSYTRKEKTIYTYFDNGKETYMDTYYWQDSAWKQSNINQLFFDDNHQNTGQKYYSRSNVTQELILYQTIDFTYNDLGNLLTQREILKENGVIIWADSLSNTYDMSGIYKTHEYKKYWSDTHDSSVERKDFTYNPDWDLTLIQYSSGYDSITGVVKSDTLIYANNKLISNTTKYFNFITGKLAISSQIRYGYPEANVFVKTVLSNVADTLSPLYSSTKTYDENGDLQESVFEFFRPYPTIERTQYKLENRNSVKGINEKLVNGIWMPNNKSSLFVQCQGEDVTGGLFETYNFTATFSNTDSQGVDEYPSNNHLLVYPNPTQDCITVKLNEKAGKNSQLKFIDISGHQTANFNISNSTNLVEGIDISNLKSGFYTLLFINNGKLTSQTKVVKN